MSLKIFHIVFTGSITILFIFLGVFYGLKFAATHDNIVLFFSIASLCLATGCVIYGKYFLHKYKHLSNL